MTVWEADNAGSEVFIAMHPVLVVMSATFDYFVYFSIPYRLNRIKKSEKEIEEEAIYQQKQLEKKRSKKKNKQKKPKKENRKKDGFVDEITALQSPSHDRSKDLENVDKITECSQEDSDSDFEQNKNVSGKYVSDTDLY